MAPNDIIYFDSAATSYLRPPEVAEAVAAAIRGFGSPGRGTYAPAVEASMAVHEARAAVARLRAALLKRDLQCPCRLQKIEDNVCMCKEFRDQIADPEFEGYCHCRLYYKEK